MAFSANSLAGGDLSKWVSQVKERHGGSSDLDTQPVKSNSDERLAEEIEKSRAERAKRRSQLAGPLSAHLTNDIKSDQTTRNIDEMKSAYAAPSFASSSSPPKRGQTLLDRYGGAQGPTGVARAGTSDAPASLALFMGGKASGPRLGKLQGDGRTTPPEARLIDYTDHRPLPGMTTNAAGGRSLASFLEARASSQGHNTSSGRVSPEKFNLSSPNRRHPAESLSPSHLSVSTVKGSQFIDRKDIATSPLKADEIDAAKEITPSQVDSQDPQTTPSIGKGISSASFSTQQTIDRMPSASLTRLKSKKMVEQRVKEAQERDGGENNSDTVVKSAPAWMISTPDNLVKAFTTGSSRAGIRGRWPEVESSPSLASEKKTSSTPGLFGNALPGMSNARELPSRNLYASNDKSESDDRREQNSAPIRLTGMGSADSPFAARQAEMEQEEEFGASTQPLESLTKGRVKPKRTTRGSAAYETGKRSASPGKNMIKESYPARAASPEKSPSLSLDTDFSSSASRQYSLPDSAEKRIADSTAALEALVQGKMIDTPVREKERGSYHLDPVPRQGTLKIARNKNSHISIDASVVLKGKAPSQTSKRTVSMEVISIKSDGLKVTLRAEDQKVLYETETQMIIHRYRNTSSNALATEIYARAGRLSKILSTSQCIEARMIQEMGKQYSCEIIDSRQGRESIELVKLLGGSLVTREGNRGSRQEDTNCMFEVRGSDGAYFVDQVDMLSSSLCSACSAIVILSDTAIVWHGIGSTASNRKMASEYARVLNVTKGSHIKEMEEGNEDEAFWACFNKMASYSDAWHHRIRHALSENDLIPHLYYIQGAGNSKKMIEQSTFSALDIRRDGVHILELPLESYVLIGPEARSKRKEINTCIEIASTLSKQMAKKRGADIMTCPIHVVVFPSIVPRELKSAFRYWHDEHLNGKSWQKAALGMNVWEKNNALEQLQSEEFPLWQLNDELFLPVGVGLEDVQGIDV